VWKANGRRVHQCRDNQATSFENGNTPSFALGRAKHAKQRLEVRCQIKATSSAAPKGTAKSANNVAGAASGGASIVRQEQQGHMCIARWRGPGQAHGEQADNVMQAKQDTDETLCRNKGPLL
jgi:hypothetical protein